MYSLKFKVTTSTCDSEGQLKLYSALQMLQDCSEMWLESEPAVKQFFLSQHMTQLLATRQVEIVRMPRFKEDLTVTTSVYEVKPMYGFRNTFITDAHGEPCLKTWSMGAFVDLTTGRLKRIDDEIIATIVMDDKRDMNYRDRRIILPKEAGIQAPPVKVLRADIDYNRHMNNACYARMAMELLPEDFEVKSMRMEYRVPAKLGDLLTPTIFNSGGTITVCLAIGTETSAIIEFSDQ